MKTKFKKISMLVMGVAMVPVLGLMLSGCATVQNTEEGLSAAGFKVHLADTPEQLTKLQSLPQQKLVPQKRHGNLYWVYADADSKRLYVGTEDQYDYYQQAKSAQELSQQQEMTAQTQLMVNETNDLYGWDGWGNWY
jgi:hypothetical protein